MTSGTPLMLIPGLNCTRRLWEAQIEALADLAEPVVPDVSRHDTIGFLAEAILAAAPPSFALAGLSMGGYVAFEILRRAPRRVSRLALIDTQARSDTPEVAEGRRRMIDLARSGKFEQVLPLLWERLVASVHLADDHLEAIVYGMAEEIGAEGFVRQQTMILGRPDSRPTLAAIHCPTLVVVGDDDRITPLPLAEEIAAGISGARLKVIAACGHLSPLERPAEVSAAMRDWLEG